MGIISYLKIRKYKEELNNNFKIKEIKIILRCQSTKKSKFKNDKFENLSYI